MRSWTRRVERADVSVRQNRRAGLIVCLVAVVVGAVGPAQGASAVEIKGPAWAAMLALVRARFPKVPQLSTAELARTERRGGGIPDPSSLPFFLPRKVVRKL